MESVKKVERKAPVLMPERMGLAEHKRHDWVIDAAVGTTIEDIQDPGYFAHVAKDFDPLDRVEVRWEDGSQIAHLRVIICERTYAKVKLLSVEKYAENMNERPAESIKFKVEFKGTHIKWCVIRISDSSVLQQNFKTREEAEVWMHAHERNQ